MPNFEFNCTFCYAVTPLMVTTTIPPVGGTFTPPAPGNYQYDVNFNQAVDPASVQDSDLTLTGNAGGSVTAVQLINGNMTARFTLHFNFGGSVTASIGAGAITANTCNANAAFTGNYTVDGCPPQNHYAIAQIGGSIVPGTTDTGNHGDDQTTTISLPFSYSLYDQTFNSINCRPTVMLSLRLPIRPSPMSVRCHGPPTTTPSSRTGMTSAPMQTAGADFPWWNLRHFHLDFRALRPTASSTSNGALFTSPRPTSDG